MKIPEMTIVQFLLAVSSVNIYTSSSYISQVSAFSFTPSTSSMKTFKRFNNNKKSSSFALFAEKEEEEVPFFARTPTFMPVTSNEEPTETQSSTTSTSTSTATLSPAILEAQKLKQRAEKERLEAERLSTQLLLDKISHLEQQLTSVKLKLQQGLNEKNLEKQQKDIELQIAMLQKQLTQDTTGGNSSNASASTSSTLKTIETSSTTPLVSPKRSIASMPPLLQEQRVQAFLSFSTNVQQLYSKATGITLDSPVVTKLTAEKIMLKCYQTEQQRKQDTSIPMDLYDIANAQAGYETLPPPIQSMIQDSVKLPNCQNNTLVVEKLIQDQKVQRTHDGGVEFKMDDPYEEEEERGSSSREFTQEELVEARKLYENLPTAMKLMLTNSINMKSDANSTMIVDTLIKEKKLLPAKDGVEFVVFGDGADEAMEQLEGYGYIKGMLPEVTRKEGMEPSEEDADAFFRLLGKKSFNPTNKPEKIPGGYIIRGENTLDNGDALVKVIDQTLKESPLKEKLYYYYMKDPTLVTDQQFEIDDFENPVIVLTGNDLTPSTNRFVKPIVTALGGLSIASFAVATCLATNMQMDLEVMETMTSPLVFSILGVMIAHEFMHQLVALKDKFKTGAPTIVPSIQLGLQGCITPVMTPPPSSNSLFDFAISGPLLGMFLSVFLMYAGLEKQVFMDAASQANLPSLPVDLVRSSGLAGGMVEWLLGDGTLVSNDADPLGALIKLHPYAIAGYVGIVTNALALLPIGNTDGGRIAQAMFGRSFAKFIRGVTLVLMVLAGFFGDDTANLLLFYAIFCQFWQKDSEIPCKNEVDGVNDVRAIIAFMTAFLVGLAVVPLSS